MPYYLTPEHDDYNQIPELQVCLAEALFDIEGILADPTALPERELMRLRDQIVNNLERVWIGLTQKHMATPPCPIT
jgi:hypothetical protein